MREEDVATAGNTHADVKESSSKSRKDAASTVKSEHTLQQEASRLPSVVLYNSAHFQLLECFESAYSMSLWSPEACSGMSLIRTDYPDLPRDL
ncbi:hypothetical protein MHYP_G00040580 [Metynnis hypsauchen]